MLIEYRPVWLGVEMGHVYLQFRVIGNTVTLCDLIWQVTLRSVK